MSNKNYPGNESFTITLTDQVRSKEITKFCHLHSLRIATLHRGQFQL